MNGERKPTAGGRAVLYARVSSDRQAEEGTIESQVSALRERIEAEGGVVDPALCFIDDDGVSGTTLVRPALERLRDLAAAGAVERLYVLAPDRLARRHGHQMVLDGMVIFHCGHTDACHFRDLLADPPTLGQICPKVIRGRRSTVATGPLPGHRFRFQCRPGDFEHFQDLHRTQVPALHILRQHISHRVIAGKLAEARLDAHGLAGAIATPAVENLALVEDDFLIQAAGGDAGSEPLKIVLAHRRQQPAQQVLFVDRVHEGNSKRCAIKRTGHVRGRGNRNARRRSYKSG